MQSSYTLACVCVLTTIGRTITILNCAVIFMLKKKLFFFFFLRKCICSIGSCWLMWETANSFYKLTESQFWREAAGDQGLFILSSSASLPTDTLKHVSSAKGFFSCFQGANDPRTRHCRLFYLTIVIGFPPSITAAAATNLKNKSLITTACECSEMPEGGRKQRHVTKVSF